MLGPCLRRSIQMVPFDWPHLRKHLKARDIRPQALRGVDEEATVPMPEIEDLCQCTQG
jgi:hypothetical protein